MIQKKFLYYDPLAENYLELSLREIQEKFSKYILNENAVSIWYFVLSKFCKEIPYRYYDEGIIDCALEVLEGSNTRTIEAFNYWKQKIDIGFENLYRKSSVTKYDDLVETGYIKITKEFFPEYLRYVEDIFGNFIALFWAIKKKRSVEGNFELKGAISVLKGKKLDLLLRGYEEKIRNSLAHGNTILKFNSIIFNSYEMNPIEFLAKFDTLQRTLNSLAIAIILFLARIKDDECKKICIGSTLTSILVNGIINRPGLKICGSVESDYYLTGKQLHISILNNFKSRNAILLDSLRISTMYIKCGATDYNRFLFETSVGTPIESLVIIDVKKLHKELENENEYISDTDVFAKDAQLLWNDEGKLAYKIKMWKILIPSNYLLAKHNKKLEWKKIGKIVIEDRYLIRKTEIIFHDKIPKVKIHAVLNFSLDAYNKENIKRIAQDITKKHLRRIVKSSNPIVKQITRFRRPKYIWIQLYKNDGCIRWLNSGGWKGGNLVAIAEYVKGKKRQPLYVDNPEEIWKNIRIRYDVDIEKLRKTEQELNELIQTIYVKRK